MQALRDCYDALVDLYAYQAETSLGFFYWTEFLQKEATTNEVTPSGIVTFLREDPNSPEAQYQYEAPVMDVLKASEEGGRNVRLLRNSVVVFAYALWEDEYRKRIATERGLPCKNKVSSDVFQDLNKYRQGILHVSGRLDKEPTVIRLFSKGDVVSFSKEQIHDLFSNLINELNQIGERYYKANPGFSLDRPLRQL